jgi:hypothetical protein
MAAALLLGLTLVAVPLYLWRRPASLPVRVPVDAAPPIDAAVEGGVVEIDAGPPAAQVAPARVVECHDPGSKHTSPVDCDHLPPIEAMISNAILATATCVPSSPAGGTIEYVVDVSFARKRTPFIVKAPKEGRTIKSARTASSCATALKRTLGTPSMEMPHQHARYKFALTATYPGTPERADKPVKP